MDSSIFEACKKRKTKPKIPFQLQNFAMNRLNYGPFREKIGLFLRECAEIEEYTVSGMPTWSTLLFNETNRAVFPLYTIEETVENSLNPFCDQCKLTGWGHHFVSRSKYHLIIPEMDHWDKPLTGDFSELRTHILYGLVHCNGFGHLICINEHKDDSNFLSECDVMNFWDRICSVLCTRKISVFDEMDLRLLYVVTFGQTWFDKWGYKFSRGSFGVTKEKYDTAVEYLKSLSLNKIVTDFRKIGRGRKIRRIIDKYREVIDVPLITFSDFLKFLLEFQVRAKVQRKTEKKMIRSACQHAWKRVENEVPINFDALVTSLANSCRWPARRIKFVLNEIVNFLKENKGNGNGKYGVSRQDLRDEIRKCVGDTGLIDFVLKSITCFALGNHIIRRSTNSSTKKLEFNIHELIDEAELNRVAFSVVNSDCRWSEESMHHAAEVIGNISAGNSGKENTMPRQQMQDKARACIRRAQLTDSVLNSMDYSMIDNQMVSRPKNPSTKRIELAIQDIVTDDTIDSVEWNVVDDVLYLYTNVLFGYKDTDPVRLATQNVLDCKHFVKEWPLEEQDTNRLMALSCQVFPSFDELETELTRPLSPGVVVVVPPSITISELKVIAQSALRDTYCIMGNFVVKQIGGLKEIEDHKVISCTLEPGKPVWVRGSGLDLGTKLRYQDGSHRLTVDCTFGTKYVDGEKLAICELCNLSQRTRCSGIDDKRWP